MLTPQSSQETKTVQETIWPKKLINRILVLMWLSIRPAVALVIFEMAHDVSHNNMLHYQIYYQCYFFNQYNLLNSFHFVEVQKSNLTGFILTIIKESIY